MNAKLTLAVLSAGVGLVASAKTVALWPLCDNKASPSVTGLFAGDSRFDLTVSSVSSVPTVSVDPSTPGGWNLPPNPDACTWFGRPVAVRGSAKSTEDGNLNSGLFYAANPTLAGYMMPPMTSRSRGGRASTRSTPRCRPGGSSCRPATVRANTAAGRSACATTAMARAIT